MILTGLLGLVCALVYGSFLEWFIHRFVMHSDRISKLAFQRHAISHHSTRRSLRNFYIPPEEEFHYSIGESSFVPILWFIHLPMYIVVGYYFTLSPAIGLGIGGLLYLLAYEILHFYIHAPRNYRFQRTRLFRFYCEYHRLHHHKARINYNVVCPLADFTLRTISLDTLRVEPSAPEFVSPDTGPRAVFRRQPRI